MNNALELVNVSKSFPGVKALTDINLEIRKNEVLGLIGENGAGKSTLLKVLTGIEQPDAGQLLVDGKPTTLRGVKDANAKGVAMVFQEQSLLENITVGENVLLGNEGATVKYGFYRWGELNKRAQVYLDRVGANIRANVETRKLSFAKRQMVEVAKALAAGEHGDNDPVVLLDEPTSVLEHAEIQTLFSIVRELRKHASVVFVSHRLDEVLEICDRVYVMRDGKVVDECVPSEVSHDDLFRKMVGEQASTEYYHEEAQLPAQEQVRLELKNLTGGSFEDVSLSIKRGEVLTLMGVQESGREDLGKALFGAIGTSSGTVELDGKLIKLKSPADVVGGGVGYIPSERKVDGAVLSMSVTENLVLAHPRQVGNGPLMSSKKMATAVERWTNSLKIKTPSGFTPMRNLSGGNQQKVVLSKWLMDPNLKLLILDTPTRGLDVGAKGDVYALIRELAARGLAVLLIADTLEEGIAMGHRVVTMKDGRITGEDASAPGARPHRTDILERMV